MLAGAPHDSSVPSLRNRPALSVAVERNESEQEELRRPAPAGLHEVALVTRGGGRIRLGGEARRLLAGSLTVAVAWEPYRLVLAPHATRMVLRFHDSEVAARLFPVRRSFWIDLGGAECQWMTARLTALRVELGREDPAAGSIVEAILTEVFAWLAQLGGERDLGSGRAVMDERAAALLTAVERSFRASPRVEEIAARLGISPRRLSEWCRERFATTPKALLQRRLLVEAERLLASTNAKVAEISAALGFQDPSYFSRFFRRQVGASPGAYRRRLRPAGGRPRGL